MNDNIKKIKSIKDIKEIFINLFPIFYKKNNHIGILSLCFYRLKKNESKILNKYVVLNDDEFEIRTLFKCGISIRIKSYRYYFNAYKVNIDMDKLLSYPPQNLITVKFSFDEEDIIMPMLYNLIHLNRYRGFTSKAYTIPDSSLVCYFRQAKLNSIAVTVREKNITDRLSKQIKINFAHLLAFITPRKDIILLYEKEANKYEESARTLYERLIDLEYKNAFFIIKRNSKHISFINEKYQNNIIYAHTFKHYYYFFKCRKFIGTETVPHSLELRCKNKYVTRKFIHKNYKQVFLQHGVMYMIALDSNSRSGFRKNGGELPDDIKIVTSSKLEAEHFKTLGGFKDENLYITGLPFYDRTIKKETSDKIVVMLTWRSWDYNLLLSNYKEASYYKLNKKIIDNIPAQYKDKVILLPHPLILNKFKDNDLCKWIPDIESYDKILEDTALLITDYSSIAYSAFYRGSNVIFCWEELDECMEHYQSHLMLNESNVFGDIAWNAEDLKKLIPENYLTKQKTKYKNRYNKIVEFHDNKNTDRLIECLKKDGLL